MSTPIVNHKSRFLIWEIAMRPRAQTDVWGGEGLRFGLAHTETRPVNLRKRRKLREETAMRAADDFSVISPDAGTPTRAPWAARARTTTDNPRRHTHHRRVRSEGGPKR